jgi:hypothetical protein
MTEKKEKEAVPDILSTLVKPEIIAFKIVGTSPLLQNNPAAFIGSTDKGALEGPKQYKDEEEARLRLYLDPDGNYCHPTEAFPKSMVKAVTGLKFGKMKMGAPNVVKGCVFIPEPFTIILDEHGEPAKEYTIDRRSVVIGGARILRCRPCWSNWRMNLALEVDTAMMTPDWARQALALAGRIKGIGDYRPEKGGGFGRFRVE